MTASVEGRVGTMFPDAVLPAVDGSVVQLETYRGRRNLVVVFTGGALGPAPVTRLLDGLVARQDELASEGAQVLVLVTPAAGRDVGRWAFPMLVDREARLHCGVGSTDDAGRPAAAVFVTDRFREIYATYGSAEGSALPGAQEIIDWLVFINIQCPECGAPEWPREIVPSPRPAEPAGDV